jgi:hypothetical protein
MLRSALEALQDGPEQDEGEQREEESKPRSVSGEDATEGGIRKIAG